MNTMIFALIAYERWNCVPQLLYRFFFFIAIKTYIADSTWWCTWNTIEYNILIQWLMRCWLSQLAMSLTHRWSLFFVGPRLNMTHATAWSYPAGQPGLLAPHNLMLDHDSIMAMAMGHFFKDLDHRLPSGKQAHNYGKIHHAING